MQAGICYKNLFTLEESLTNFTPITCHLLNFCAIQTTECGYIMNASEAVAESLPYVA